MAVTRATNFVGGMRLDVPHTRGMESAVAADFDLLAGNILAGKKSMVVNGFKITITNAVGGKATSLQMVTAGSSMLHYNGSEAGTIFSVPDDRAVEGLHPTNARVFGSFTASSTNYVGIDIVRKPDVTTADQAMFLDADSLLEIPKTIPLGRTLDYTIVIGTTDFTSASTVAAVAKVVTDASNNVVSIQDARELMFRLGTGGSVPNPEYAYPWPEGRLENVTGEVFAGGDRPIGSFKTWANAIMTRIWEIGGGQRWYSSVADRNVKLTRSGTFFTNGEYFEWDGTNLHWKGLTYVFPNSSGWYNDIVNQTADLVGTTDLADGECIYVDLDYSADRTGATAIFAAKASTKLLGSPTTPGSRQILAWRVGSSVFTKDSLWPVGSHFTPATTTSLGVVKLSFAPTLPASPVVLTDTERNRASAVNGTPGGVAGLWRSSASQNYQVLATGLFRGASQGSGDITIGRTANDQAVLIGGNDFGSSGAGVVVEDTGYSSFSNGQNGITFSVRNAGVSRMNVTSRGDITVVHNASLSSVNCREDSLTPSLSYTITSGFEDVVHVGTGMGTLMPDGNSGGIARDITILITTAGTAGGGIATLQWSYDAGITFNGVDTIIPAGNLALDDGVTLFCAGVFVLNDRYKFRPRFVPQASFSDRDARVRTVVDHNGYVMGRRGEFNENWMEYSWFGTTTIPTPSMWELYISTSGSITVNNANAFFGGCSVFLSYINNNINDVLCLFTHKKFLYISDDTSFVSEFDCIANSAQTKFQIGLRDASGDTANGVWFEKNDQGVWVCKVSSGGVVTSSNTTDATVGEAVNGRLRIEIVGKDVSHSTYRTARFWLNEQLVGEISDANVPIGPLNFNVCLKSLANNASFLSSIGQIHCQWNRFASSPAL